MDTRLTECIPTMLVQTAAEASTVAATAAAAEC